MLGRLRVIAKFATLMLKKTFLLMLLAAAVSMAMAQDKNLDKAKKMLQDKQWAKARSAAEKALAKDKNNTEWWYLKASAEYEMSRMEKYRGGKVNYFREAVKSAVKARQKDETGAFYDDYASWMKEITVLNNKEAMASYAQASYARAIQMYRNSFLLTGDTIAYGMLGLSYIRDRQEREGIKILKTVAVWNYGAYSTSTCPGTYMREPFEVLSQYYIDKGYPDSARTYTEMGLTVYPLNNVLKANVRSLLEFDLDEAAAQGYNANYIEVVNRALSYFPADTQFLYAQNYYYLQRLGNLTRSKPWDEADLLLGEFYNMKKQAVAAGVVNATDIFLIKDSAAFMFQLLDYFLRRNNQKAIAFCFKKWYPVQTRIPAVTEATMESLLKSPPDNISKRLIAILFADAREDYPKNKKITQYRSDYFNKWVSKPARQAELFLQLDMCDALILDFPADKKLPAHKLRLLQACTDSSIADGNMYTSWRYYQRLAAEFPGAPGLDKTLKRLSERDFQERYAGTRIQYMTVKGVKTANTGWNGNSLVCDAGSLPDSTLYKVIDRINYFRQNAGVRTPMSLSLDRVKKCQEAASMFAPKGIFSREPTPETHECYTVGAHEAAANAQCILEPNPAQCVTIFMDDKKSDEMINRRAILNPGSQYAGFGSAENNSVFWLLDLAPSTDSAWYKTHFVAWPGRYAPRMLTMQKWTFSMDASLREADIKVTDETGADVPVNKSWQPADQMNLETLIFKPSADLSKKAAGTTWTVKVTLKNKKAYTYQVSTF